MKRVVFTLCLITFTAGSLWGQSGSINNTLGTGGTFLIKDGSTTFFSLSQSNGEISVNKTLMLPVTTDSTIGVIYKGTDRFIHDFHPSGSFGQNTFVGVRSGNFTMTGSGVQACYNTAVGASTLASLTNGTENVAIGYQAMFANTMGYTNSAVGSYALAGNTTGSANSAFGTGTLSSNTTGLDNAAFGNGALSSNSTGNYNSSFGFEALFNNTVSENSAFGTSSLYSNTTGTGNSAFGYNSLYTNTTGDYNSAFGRTALYSNTAGFHNSAFGSASLVYNTGGYDNSAFGYLCLSGNTTGYRNSAVGASTLRLNTTGNENCAFGWSSLSYNSTGNENSAYGNSSLAFNTTGSSNSAFGVFSLYSNTTGTQNTAVGYKALLVNIGGIQNTAVGDSALYGNTGNYNTAIGYNAGSQVTSGANLTLIGIDANPSSGTTTNEITLGNGYVATLRCNTQTITSLSDARDKRNVRDLPLGLNFLMTVKPRLFNWDRREWYEDGKPDGSKMKEEPTAGFVAQELDTAQVDAHAEWLNLVLKTNPDRLEATYGNLLPIMVKAIQDLKSENDVLKNELAALRASIAEQVRQEVQNVIAASRNGISTASTSGR